MPPKKGKGGGGGKQDKGKGGKGKFDHLVTSENPLMSKSRKSSCYVLLFKDLKATKLC